MPLTKQAGSDPRPFFRDPFPVAHPSFLLCEVAGQVKTCPYTFRARRFTFLLPSISAIADNFY
jgi:hypothetical protein